MEIIVLIVTVFCLLGYGAPASSADQKLKVTLFSKSYCPHCMFYMKRQLTPALERFSSNILIDLVPFGFPNRFYVRGQGNVRCQHAEECYRLKLQACAIQVACGDQGSVQCAPKKLGEVFKYIACIEESPDQRAASDECAKEAGLVPAKITECATGDKGESLLNLYGKRTVSFSPYLRHIPSVAINDEHNEAAEENLQAEICRLKPNLCKD